MWEERGSQEQHLRLVPSFAAPAATDRRCRPATAAVTQLPSGGRMVVAAKYFIFCLCSGRCVETYTLESNHHYFHRFKLVVGQHGFDRLPAPVADTILQPSIHDSGVVFQRTSS